MSFAKSNNKVDIHSGVSVVSQPENTLDDVGVRGDSRRSLSDTQLLADFEKLVRTERKITHQILRCIAEIDKRRLFEASSASLFEYLVKKYGYSPGAATRRIDGARLLREIPEVASKIESGVVSLSQISQVQRASRDVKKRTNQIVSPEKKREILLKIEDSTQKESEKIIAQILDIPIVLAEKIMVHKNDSVTVTLNFSKEQMEILEQVQNMAAHCVPSKNWSELFSYLAKKELSRRTSQRKVKNKTKVKANESTTISLKTHPTTDDTKIFKSQESQRKIASSPRNQRVALSAQVRKTLLHPRAQCAHIDKNSGQQCLSRRFLQIDHIQSWSREGTNAQENLQVLCGVHNRYKYKMEK
ncbi:MAG: HNH endonuclease [Bdellovibrionaceae bacterium]|nr:HNH endonuclease [Pseudobdellovibrionaceae bacterium]